MAALRNRLAARWLDWRESLGFLPTVCVLLAVALALGLVRLDEALELPRRSGRAWAFGGGAEGARGVLQAIAGSVITVAGTVFSVTIVALQLASGQFTPRVLRTFTGDRGVQLVLGVFIGTFAYCLLVLRSVRSATDGPAGEAAAFVPAVSVTVAVLLAMGCVAALVFYVHRIATSIEVATVVERVTRETSAALARVPGDTPAEAAALLAAARARRVGQPAPVFADRAGYLRLVAADDLGAPGAEVLVRVAHPTGAFVLPGTTLAEVWPATALDERLAEAVRGACVLGPERAVAHDPAFGLRQLADIAVRALSPGINDPTTAMRCVDRLTQLLVEAAAVAPDAAEPERAEPRGEAILLQPAPSFADLARTAFAQILHYGREDAVLLEHVAASLRAALPLLPPPARDALAEPLGLAEARLAQLAPGWLGEAAARPGAAADD